jgi:hypothetical protein
LTSFLIEVQVQQPQLLLQATAHSRPHKRFKSATNRVKTAPSSAYVFSTIYHQSSSAQSYKEDDEVESNIAIWKCKGIINLSQRKELVKIYSTNIFFLHLVEITCNRQHAKHHALIWHCKLSL